MNFFTISTFRDVVASLIKKPREGYSSVVADICAELLSMPDNILRDTNERIIQTPEYRVVKLRVANSNLKLSKSNGFRLVYLVSLITDDVFLLTVFPKRGTKGISNIPNAEYVRLLKELSLETSSKLLHQVDITKGLKETSVI
jgi:mRNA-degrading endonuclease RelE of RelBE toxin-antitoxin system